MSCKVVVWFSCGAASAVAAKLTLELFPDAHIVNNPIAEEDEDNRRFLLDVQDWLNVPIEIATNHKFPSASAVEVWEKRKFMSGPNGAPCTIELKKEARRQWELRNKPDWHVLGFTAEEQKRVDRFILTERDNILPILVYVGYSKQDCMDIITDAGIRPPRVYEQGYPNANCIGCVKATSPTYWNHVRNTHPSVFKHRMEQSRQIGAKLAIVKSERIPLHQLDPSTKGRPMKSMQIDCGIFCEERERA